METWTLPDGAVTVEEEGTHMVRFRIDCLPPCDPARLLRCYGEGAPNDLLIGVLEPKNGRLILERRISRETIRQAGIGGGLPSRFYLSDGGAREPAEPPPDEPEDAEEPPSEEDAPASDEEENTSFEEPEDANPEACSAPTEEPPKTGDALLDAVIERGEAECTASPDGLRITCPFSPAQPFALAFIAPLCRTEQDTAVLDWKPDISDVS